ncbi:XRE family transcriptional regulator [Klebsiella pasteurii]|uniref:XRE family transcriptional regulator n=1 Tax=Klebsiella pasteurii TaxID=2587529 RepID=UPI0035D11DCD
MQKKKLTSEQIADAERLKSIYEAKKKSLGLTMQKIADEMDISLSALGHYFYGRNSLNTRAVSALAQLLQVDVSDISPSLDKELRQQSRSLQLSLSEHQLQERVPVRLQIVIDTESVNTAPLGGYLRLDNTHLSAFGVQIIGTGLWPRVKSGEFLVVEPGRPCQPGDDVYVLLNGETQPLITMLMLDSGAGYTVTDYASNRPSMLYKDNIRAIYPISAIVNQERFIPETIE